MRLYSTDLGIGREDQPGRLDLLDLPHCDLGDLIRAGNLQSARVAPIRQTVRLHDVEILPTVGRPGKIPIIGLNYQSHADEAIEALAKLGRDVQLPTEPNFHLTPGSAVCATGQPIQLPSMADSKVDYEGEIAVVIGTQARAVPETDAWGCVAGLTIANDVSARDIQQRAMTGDVTVSIAQAKSFDTFKPLGPCLVTADEFSEPLNIGLRTVVNGELRQEASTSEFIYQISELISYVSGFMTLDPGDVLCTGSPSGVGFHSGQFLTPGDLVEITVDEIGTLSNTVSASQFSSPIRKVSR